MPDDDGAMRPEEPTDLVGVSPAMRAVFKAVGRAAATEEPVVARSH